ncbi:MAG: hypothetical protein N2111_11935 [Candidatus Sumerlaeaceae bacterium]|nr:hypothetical protein [Candidatus Sumerlaeaceae bacterium]
MERAELLERLRGMLHGFAPCDYLKGVVEVHRFVESLDEAERSEFIRALLVLLARPEDATPVALNLAQDLHLIQARYVLLSHLYSRNFFPPSEEVADPSPWTDVQRGLVALTLARLGAQAAVPMLQQEVSRRLAACAGRDGVIARLLRRFLARTPPARPCCPPILDVAEDAEGVAAATSRETRALLRALAMLSPETAVGHLVAAVDADGRSPGHVAAILDGLGETVVPCDDSAGWVGLALRRLPASHPARLGGQSLG